MSARRLIGKPISQINQWTSADYLIFISTRSIVTAGLLFMQDPLIAAPLVQLQQATPQSVGGMQLPFQPPTQQQQQPHPAQTGFFYGLFGSKSNTEDAQ